ncbi:MAG: hypothetical protein Q9M28_09590 [Mariprofundaceae bacterium]|nr:hypothetical protein [Mariprofundaceae bacterium]
MFQDSMVGQLKEYFETPDAAGPLQRREYMIRLRHLDESNKDYFSAFYNLDHYLDEFVYSRSTLNHDHHLRMNTVMTESVVEF